MERKRLWLHFPLAKGGFTKHDLMNEMSGIYQIALPREKSKYNDVSHQAQVAFSYAKGTIIVLNQLLNDIFSL